MKKIITCLLLVLSLLIVTGCKDDKLKWAEETYFDDLPVPCEKIDKMTESKKTDEYMPFGPSIVISAFISIFIPSEILITSLKAILTLGMYKK